MAIRELSVSEIGQVSGGGVIADATTIGGGAGSLGGFLAVNTLRGAAVGGAAGAAGGFLFGLAWATGSWIYDSYVA